MYGQMEEVQHPCRSCKDNAVRPMIACWRDEEWPHLCGETEVEKEEWEPTTNQRLAVGCSLAACERIN